jgi:pimeloyl-ACP methyl ester carboxylesterase
MKMVQKVRKYLPLAYGTYFNLLSYVSPVTAAQKAFLLFCTPRKGKVLKSQYDYLMNARDEVLSVNGTPIQTYRWPGSKKTVLLIHGWESNTYRWRNLITILQNNHYTVVAFDGPAHGLSGGTTFNVLLYSDCIQQMILKHSPDYVVAHSVGGMAALYHQHLFPDSTVKKLVTIGAPADLSELMSHYQKMLKYNERVHEALNAYFIRRFQFGINDFSTGQFVENNQVSGLLIHDELDTVSPVSASEKVHARWQNSRFIKTHGLGHSLHHEEVNTHILDFLNS